MSMIFRKWERARADGKICYSPKSTSSEWIYFLQKIYSKYFRVSIRGFFLPLQVHKAFETGPERWQSKSLTEKYLFV